MHAEAHISSNGLLKKSFRSFLPNDRTNPLRIIFYHKTIHFSYTSSKSSVKSALRLLLLWTIFLTLSIKGYNQNSQIFSTAGSYTFTPPAWVTTIDIQLWGGGGSSGNNTSGRARGGGGGGAYTSGTINVIPGIPITLVVGAGGIYASNNTTTSNGGASSFGSLIANGGARGVVGNNIAQNGGAGGTSTSNPGGVTAFVSYAGGNGGNGYVSEDNGGGGGGGASASPAGSGDAGHNGNGNNGNGNGNGNGTGGTGATGVSGGGDGGRGANNDGSPNSSNGIAPGGGGGGRGDDSGNDTNGADGQIIISWTTPSGYCDGNATSVISNKGTNNANRILSTPDNSYTTLDDQGDQLIVKLNDLLNAGGSIEVTWKMNNNTNSTPSVNIELSADGTTWSSASNYNVSSTSWVIQSIPLTINTQYVRFTEANAYNLDIDAISYNTPCGTGCVTPQLFDVTGGGTYCSGAGLPIGLSGSETGVQYQLYLGASSVGTAVSGTGTAITFGNQLITGTYTILATRSLDGCTGTMNGSAILSSGVPDQPSVISGLTTPCVGSSQTYQVVDVPGITYHWTFPSGWLQTAGGTTHSVTVTTGSIAGEITVIPTSACGTGTSRTLTITTPSTAPAQPGSITGPIAPCSGNLANYCVPLVSGNNYQWSVPSDWTISDGQGTNNINVKVGSVAGNISVVASNACGNSSPQLFPVTMGTITTPTISANYCAGGGYIRLTASEGETGTTYLWNTGETTSAIMVNIAGIYEVTVTNASGCSASAHYDISTELVTNGDFSAGNTGFTHSTYEYRPDIAGNSELNPEGLYSVGPDAHAFHSNFWGRDHTSGTGNFMIVNGYPGAPQPVVWATTVSVIPGTAYYFSAWALSLNSKGNYAELQFKVNNILVGTTAPLPARAENNNPPFNWIQFYGNWTAPTGVTSVSIEIIDKQTAATGNDFGLDDISFATLAPMPATIAPTTNAGTTGLCPGQTLELYANLKGGKAPFTFSWSGPNGFSSTIANPTIPNVTSAHAGIYTLTITDGYGCAPVVASALPVKINATPECSILGSNPLCPGSTGNSFVAPTGMSSYLWSASGNGSIVGSKTSSTVEITAGMANNSPLTLNLTFTNSSGCSASCQEVIQVEDNTPPTFSLPILNSEYCVEYVVDALYNPGKEDTEYDITYIRPDYFLFAQGNTLLNISNLDDNCGLSASPITWQIDFGNDGTTDFSGTGQLSANSADIKFPIGTHKIDYSVTDAVGNITTQSTFLNIKERPIISKNF